jgi:pyruvate,water dikinase
MPPILWLGEPDCHRRELVGGKAANLSRMAAEYRVPPGFCITATAVMAGEFIANESDLYNDVAAAYNELADKCNIHDPSVAVRSSAMDEDGSAASFAGQYESYLNLVGAEAIFQGIERCWTSANSKSSSTQAGDWVKASSAAR